MLAEFAPFLVPQFDALVVSLAVLCAVIVAWGMVTLADGIVRAFFGTVTGSIGWIPLVGKVVTQPIKAIEHKLVGALGAAETKLDKWAGHYWHSLAALIVWVGQEIQRHANLLWVMSNVLLGPELTKLLQEGLHLVRREIHAARSQLHALERAALHRLPAQLKSLERFVRHTTGTLTGQLGHVIDWDIPHLRSRTKAIEHELGDLFHRVKGANRYVGTAAFAGAVAWAISYIGAGWIRCTNVKNVGKHVCRAPTRWLENLLTGLVLVFGTYSLITFATAIYDLLGVGVKEIRHFWRADLSLASTNPGLGDVGATLVHLHGEGYVSPSPGLGDVA